MFETRFRVPAAMSVAFETNATQRPSALIEGKKLAPFGSPPPGRRLTREVFPVTRSRTKTREARGRPDDPSARGEGSSSRAADAKATYRPLPLMAGDKLGSSRWAPQRSTLARDRLPVAMSAT